jgi:hypothetical protein
MDNQQILHKYIGKTLAESVTAYDSKVCTIQKHYRNILLAPDVDHLRQNARELKSNNISIKAIGRVMEAEESIAERIEKIKFKLFNLIIKFKTN